MDQVFEQAGFRKFKFKELKVYSSTEWLAKNKKKYRQVFDRFETTYIYAELSFFNKYFDVDNWEVSIELNCFELRKNKKKICSLDIKRQVSKFDNIVYIREGWGNKKDGAFWKKGTYYWEAWIEGEKVATKYFYVEDAGQNYESQENPYVELQALKLYEGQYDDVNEDDRTYLKSFSGEESRYIYAEMTLKNLHLHSDWHCELFFKFYNSARELKGQVTKLQTVKRGDDNVKISAGWGTNVKGSWRKGHYTVEIVFMNNLIAVLPFVVGDEFEEGLNPVQLPNRKTPMLLMPDENLNQTFDEVMSQLDRLVGLQEIKQQVRDHAKYIQFLQLRKDRGFEEKEEINVHSVFTGNPGTGKTTVAKMMGMLYKKMGLLTKGHVYEVDRVDLVGEYIGQTAPKVKEVIEKARGGVLFIDEAYALARTNDDSKDFGREVIEILVKEMSNGLGDLVVIVAGYPKEMHYFIDSNPGLKSRFKLFYEFSDYMPNELSEIASYACVEKEVKLTEGAKKGIDEIIREAFRNRDRSFGNARFVYDIIEKGKINLGLRVMDSSEPKSTSKDNLEIINADDVSKIDIDRPKRLPDLPIDEQLLEESLLELNSLIGIEPVKTQINEMVNIVRYYRDSSRDVLNRFFLHTVLVGNPGTGKTTVARILTKIYKALGILERGHMVETDRQGLIAGFVGQTAIKTAERIDEAMGGVLFIDEAYALSHFNGMQGDYGNEAIQTILKRMEDHRGEFFVFAAGYPTNMEIFLKANPGLASRFDKMLKFEDYSPVELQSIAMKMIADEEMSIDQRATEYLADHWKFIYDRRDKYFGNAREVRKLIKDVIKAQNLRLAALPLTDRDPTRLAQITIDDVNAVVGKQQEDIFQKKRIGFKS